VDIREVIMVVGDTKNKGHTLRKTKELIIINPVRAK
jgi:hypothetical protein